MHCAFDTCGINKLINYLLTYLPIDDDKPHGCKGKYGKSNWIDSKAVSNHKKIFLKES